MMHKLPDWVHVVNIGGMFVAEIICPLLVFLCGWPRVFAGVMFALLQVGIQATGNFGYFNILTLFMSLQFFDTESSIFETPFLEMFGSLEGRVTLFLAFFYLLAGCTSFIFNSWCSSAWMRWPGFHKVRSTHPSSRALVVHSSTRTASRMFPDVGYQCSFCLSIRCIVEYAPNVHQPIVLQLVGGMRPWLTILEFLWPLRAVHAYGVFPPNSLPDYRWMAVFEGSFDGKTWTRIPFRYLTTDVKHPPKFGTHSLQHHPYALMYGHLYALIYGCTIVGSAYTPSASHLCIANHVCVVFFAGVLQWHRTTRVWTTASSTSAWE